MGMFSPKRTCAHGVFLVKCFSLCPGACWAVGAQVSDPGDCRPCARPCVPVRASPFLSPVGGQVSPARGTQRPGEGEEGNTLFASSSRFPVYPSLGLPQAATRAPLEVTHKRPPFPLHCPSFLGCIFHTCPCPGLSGGAGQWAPLGVRGSGVTCVRAEGRNVWGPALDSQWCPGGRDPGGGRR